jgi:hypothetical protein
MGKRGKKMDKERDDMTKLTPPSLRTLLKKPGRHSDGQGLFFRVLGTRKLTGFTDSGLMAASARCRSAPTRNWGWARRAGSTRRCGQSLWQ